MDAECLSVSRSCRNTQWIADATFADEQSDIENASDMLVDSWYE